MMLRLLAGTLALAAILVAALPAAAQPAAKAEAVAGPAWSTLNPQQREALAPLAPHWDRMEASAKRKWLDIGARYPQLSPEGKARLHARMTEFARLTPQQRQTARENFKRAYELPRDQRQSLVEEFQSLPEDKKRDLVEQGKNKPKRAAPAPKATAP